MSRYDIRNSLYKYITYNNYMYNVYILLLYDY